MAPDVKRFSSKEISLCKRWDAFHPVVAIQNAIMATFPDLELMSPPIDPYLLAKRRGIKQVLVRKIDADGFISQTSNGDYIVELNEEHLETRRRFTLSHEIAHTFFFDLSRTEENRERYRTADCPDLLLLRDPAEEYLCNIAASEMLMPRTQFMAKLSEHGPTAFAVTELARQFRTSLWATAWRIAFLLPYKIAISCWQYDSSGDIYQTLWTTPLSASRYSPVQRYSIDRTVPVYKKFSEERSFRGWSWAKLGGPVGRYFMDGLLLREQPRRLITATVLDNAAERILAPYPFCAKGSIQSELF